MGTLHHLVTKARLAEIGVLFNLPVCTIGCWLRATTVLKNRVLLLPQGPTTEQTNASLGNYNPTTILHSSHGCNQICRTNIEDLYVYLYINIYSWNTVCLRFVNTTSVTYMIKTIAAELAGKGGQVQRLRNSRTHTYTMYSSITGLNPYNHAMPNATTRPPMNSQISQLVYLEPASAKEAPNV